MAQEALVKMIAVPRTAEYNRNMTGLEVNQRSIEDIRNIIVTDIALGVTSLGNGLYSATLPGNYYVYIRGRANANNGVCVKELECFMPQLDDRSEKSPFDRSDFLWGEINMNLVQNNKIRLVAPDFVVTGLILDYVRKPRKIYHAETEYTDLDGTIIKGSQDCELSELIHEDIVDYACFIATDSRQSSDYQSKVEKLKFVGL